MLTTDANLLTLPLERETFISLGKRCSRTCITDALRCVNNLYTGLVTDDGFVKFLEIPVEMYQAFA